MRPQHSLDRLKNAGKPWKEVTPHTGYVFRYQIWNRNGNMKKNVHFAALFPWNPALITYNAPSSVNPSIHIPCCYWYSRIYLFTFNNRIYIQKIYLLTFTGVFLIHDYICSHWFPRCLYSHSTCYIHSHSWSKYSFSIFCAPLLRITRS